ncbi:MAG: hypothetical protein GKR98_15865 [Boseongicola sp.]|nr:MAG: hypothetical protein GKR98_15865 [Boseongicola sp.]
MSELFTLSFDALAISALTCMVLREVFIATLPNRIAGPGGNFIDTDRY